MPYLLHQQEMKHIYIYDNCVTSSYDYIVVCTGLSSSILIAIDIRLCGHKIVCNDPIDITRPSNVPSTTQHYNKVPKYFIYNIV